MKKSKVNAEERLKAIIFLLDQDEVDAITGYSPMTQQAFDSILEKCEGQGVNNFLYEIMSKYPDYLKSNVERLGITEYTKRFLNNDETEMLVHSERLWDELCDRLKNQYGVNNI